MSLIMIPGFYIISMEKLITNALMLQYWSTEERIKKFIKILIYNNSFIINFIV